MLKPIAILVGVLASVAVSPGMVNAPEAIAETETEIIANIEVFAEPNPTPNPSVISQNSLNLASLPPTDPYCSCVTTARLKGLNLPKLAYAKDLRPNLARPQLNAGVIFSYEPYGHIAVIKGMKGRDLLIVEGNFKKCIYTERWVSADDPHIIGYWKELSNDNQD